MRLFIATEGMQSYLLVSISEFDVCLFYFFTNYNAKNMSLSNAFVHYFLLRLTGLGNGIVGLQMVLILLCVLFASQIT